MGPSRAHRGEARRLAEEWTEALLTSYLRDLEPAEQARTLADVSKPFIDHARHEGRGEIVEVYEAVLSECYERVFSGASEAPGETGGAEPPSDDGITWYRLTPDSRRGSRLAHPGDPGGRTAPRYATVRGPHGGGLAQLRG